MKNIITLVFALMVATVSFGQLKVHTDGNVGVGQGFTDGTLTAAAEQLDVDGNAQVIGDAKISGSVKIGDTGVNPLSKLSITEGLTSLHIGKSSNGASNSSNLVDITPGLDGSLRIGAWDLNSNASGGAAIQFFSDAAVAFKGQAYIDAGSDPNAGIFLRTDAKTRLNVKANGRVGIGTTSPSEKLHVNGNIMAAGGLVLTSDKRLKQNVSEFTRGLTEVMQLNPITYEYNGLGGTIENDFHVGIFAQDLKKVAPELVEKFQHDIVEEATLESEHKVISQETYLAIKDSEIKYLLINAIKEQQSEIETLEEKIELLSSLVAEIKNTNNNPINVTKITFEAEPILEQNSPNPFDGVTTINYTVPSKASSASFQIHDISGRLIKTVDVQNGKGQLILNAGELGSNTYTYTLVIDGQIFETKKMILAK